MATIQTNLNYNPSNPSQGTFDPAGPFELNDGDELKVTFVGFPSGSTMTQTKLQSLTNPETTITFPPQEGATGIFNISDNSGVIPPPAPGLAVLIADDEKPAEDDTYELSFTGDLAGGGTWGADPEVINKAGGG